MHFNFGLGTVIASALKGNTSSAFCFMVFLSCLEVHSNNIRIVEKIKHKINPATPELRLVSLSKQ